jgi:hypothetical protein
MMTTPKPNQVSLAARAIAASFVERDGTHVRITLTLDPSTKHGDLSLDRWPDVLPSLLVHDIAKKQEVVKLCVAPADTSHRDAVGSCDLVDAILAWTLPAEPVANRIRDLWQRMMAPSRGFYPAGTSPWDDLWTILNPDCQTPTATPPVIVSPPHCEASLTFTLERGRMLLDALAGPGAMLHDRAPPRRNEAALARSRRPAACEIRTRVAMATGTNTDASQNLLPADNSDHWLDLHRSATAAVFLGRQPRPVWPAPRFFAQAALGNAGSNDDHFDKVRKAHLYCTPVGAPIPDPSSQHQALDAARRRMGALMALPTLQRLFGLAVDVLVPIDAFENAAKGKDLLLIAPEKDQRCWTLTRFVKRAAGRPGYFGVVSWKERDPAATDVVTIAGLRNLGQSSSNSPRYDLCTVDPVLATEGDLTRKESGSPDSDNGLQLLHHGGLRLLDREAALQCCTWAATEDKKRTLVAKCLSGEKPLIQDADDLATGDRLMVGLLIEKDVRWRMPQYRHITIATASCTGGLGGTRTEQTWHWTRLRAAAYGTRYSRPAPADNESARAQGPQRRAEKKRCKRAADDLSRLT